MGIEEVVSPLRMRGMGAILARIKTQLRERRLTDRSSAANFEHFETR